MSIRAVASMLLAAAVVIVPASALAQQIGVKAGVNFASLTPEEDESPDISRRPGPIGGLWVRVAPARRVSVHVEGLFSEKGVRFDATALGLDGLADVRIRYLETPLLARADVGAPSSTRVFVVGGVAPAFKLSARSKASFEGREETKDTSDDIESLDIGLVGGVGLEFGRALIEVRYTYGLRRINKDANDPEDSVKNRVIGVTAGVRFR
jgi:outer membrane protein with beta-barrel domain